jgi:hypothetical protein
MLKFINKQGKEVMEVTDSGDISFVSEELKASGLIETVEKSEDKKENE